MTLFAAGSIELDSQGSKTDKTSWTSRQGIPFIMRKANPGEILLLVENLKPRTRRKSHQATTTPENNTAREDNDNPLDNFFAVQWAQPRQSTLAAAIFLAKSSPTLSPTVGPTNSIHSYRANTAGIIERRKRQPKYDRRTLGLLVLLHISRL